MQSGVVVVQFVVGVGLIMILEADGGKYTNYLFHRVLLPAHAAPPGQILRQSAEGSGRTILRLMLLRMRL